VSALAERMAALRRQAGATRTTPAGVISCVTPTPGKSPALKGAEAPPHDSRPAAALGASTRVARGTLLEELRRQLGLRERLASRVSVRAHPDRALPGDEISPGLRCVEARFEWLTAPPEIEIGFGGGEAVGRERFLHFDTETTGLAGGTGTRAFMIGASDWSGEGLRLRQLTITTLAAETAMLRVFAGWLRPDTVLVSYNGRSYDAPLLAARYRLALQENPLQDLAHLDLMHPVRRRWRDDWPNCRLATAEQRLLGVEREDDLPGSQAPRAWLDYLRGGSAADLRRVHAHNAQDLRSLAGILLRLAGRPQEPSGSTRSTRRIRPKAGWSK
jgi:uncharacterized protein YprB with RNaseH-like and TPR domain